MTALSTLIFGFVDSCNLHKCCGNYLHRHILPSLKSFNNKPVSLGEPKNLLGLLRGAQTTPKQTYTEKYQCDTLGKVSSFAKCKIAKMRSKTLPLTFHSINTLVPPQTRSAHEIRAEWQTADAKCRKKRPQVMTKWPSSSLLLGENINSQQAKNHRCSEEDGSYAQSRASTTRTAAIYQPEQGHTARRLCNPMTTTTWSLLSKLQAFLQQGRGFAGSFTHSHKSVLRMHNSAGLNSPDSKPNSQNHQEWVRLSLGSCRYWRSLCAPNTRMSWISCMECNVFIWLLGSLLWDF